MNLKKKAGALALAVVLTAQVHSVMAQEQSALDGYDRAKAADEHYRALNGDREIALSKTDPEFAAMMKKYIYGDIARQITLNPVERSLVKIAVLTTNQNESMLEQAFEEALTAKATPLQIREAIYQITPYVGFAKVVPSLEIMNQVLQKHGVKLPLPDQGTTTDADRFTKGLGFQVATYGDRINKMRAAAPDDQKHLQDDLSAFCFGDVYTRGTHDLKMREFLTVAAIGTLGIEAQFRSHVHGTLSAGGTKEEVIGVITAMNPYIGFPRTLGLLKIANEVFAEREK